MLESKELNRMPSRLHSEMSEEEPLRLKDFKEVIAAGLMLLIGVGISVGGCTLHVRDEIKKRNAQKEAERMPVREQKTNVPTMHKIPSFIIR